MTQPLNRRAKIPARGPIDEEAGEFWVENPFMMPEMGHNLSAYERNRTYINIGDLQFIDATFASDAALDSDSRSVVAADFDRDGAPDLLVASVGGGPLRLLRNRIDTPAHRVGIGLVGTKSNRPGIGSRVVARVGDRRIVRDVFAVNAFQGQAPPELIVGVGPADKIDELTVRWPTGKVQRFTDVPVDRHLTITEGKKKYAQRPLK